MLLQVAIKMAATGPAAANPLFMSRSCGEGAEKMCYGVDGGQSQGLNPDNSNFWTMPRGVDCPKWGVPVDGAGTELAMAKHNNPRYATYVLYEDIANSIDRLSRTVGSCGRNGGQIGVVANMSNPQYATEEYKKSGARPDDIVMRLVRAPDSSSLFYLRFLSIENASSLPHSFVTEMINRPTHAKKVSGNTVEVADSSK